MCIKAWFSKWEVKMLNTHYYCQLIIIWILLLSRKFMTSFTHHSTRIRGVPTRHFAKHWGYKLPKADKICPHGVYVLVEKTDNKVVNKLINSDSNECQLDSKTEYPDRE